jgi:hypothetical protein
VALASAAVTRQAAALAALALSLFAASPAAILIRHDRPDAEYRALGARFPAVGSFGRAGTGTLIAPQWVLTAAHVAAGTRRDATITFGATAYAVDRIVIHPEWREMGPKDIALVRLARPVGGVAPLPVSAARDEVGKPIVFVGNGGTGTGLTGPQRPEDGVMRGATNIVDAADAEWLYFTFDEPPGGTRLEGISGPGDSGGPAIVEGPDGPRVIGVSVFGQPGAKGRGTYGAKEGYTRVSSHAEWIRGVVGGGN